MLEALVLRMREILSKPEHAKQIDLQLISTWLFMLGRLHYRDMAVMDAAVGFMAMQPQAQFPTIAAMSTALWVFARLAVAPGPLLGQCMLSSPDLLLPYRSQPPSAQVRAKHCT
jgi:hypothetical protein